MVKLIELFPEDVMRRTLCKASYTVGLLLLAGTASRAEARAQTSPSEGCVQRSRRTSPGLVTQFTARKLTAADAQTIRANASADKLSRALSTYYGNLRYCDLPNWVVYVDKAGNVAQGMFRGNEPVTQLYDDPFVWFVLFSERPLATDSALFAVAGKYDALRDTVDLKFQIRVIRPAVDQSLIALAKTLGRPFGFEASSVTESAVSDSSKYFKLDSASYDPAVSLWVAQGRFSLPRSAEVQLSLAPSRGKRWDASRRTAADSAPLIGIHRDLVVQQRRPVEVGVAFLGYFEREAVTEMNEQGASLGRTPKNGVTPYLTFSANVIPDREWLVFGNRASTAAPIGLSVGTSLSSGFGDDAIAGVSVSRILSGAGLLAGYGWRKRRVASAAADERTKFLWTGRLMVGVEIRM